MDTVNFMENSYSASRIVYLASKELPIADVMVFGYVSECHEVLDPP